MQSRRSCPVRDRIMRRYDQELLGAPLWCTTQQEEGLWIQGVNAIVPQRWVFVCASELALDESLSHRHMGVVYHRGRSPSASTSESHGGGRGMIGAAGELDYFSAHIRLREPGKLEDKADSQQLLIIHMIMSPSMGLAGTCTWTSSSVVYCPHMLMTKTFIQYKLRCTHEDLPLRYPGIHSLNL
ncbi:hypothetical protein B296_00019366 [Ensete ventricosum]|uniref:Uncharacterized protein n=1 Tax=Ensete ventricosum TaxID=4639 RepID=A0A426WY50_ENSVE|nr:hypothetical protein B296_00019366 [Ensete ventricosum]